MRKQVPSEKTKDVLAFATMKPADRLNSIRKGLGVLAYGQSEYVRVGRARDCYRGGRVIAYTTTSTSGCTWPKTSLCHFKHVSWSLPLCSMARAPKSRVLPYSRP